MQLLHKSLAKSAGVIASFTLLSRALGFIRDIVIARIFGVYTYAQAFVIAFKIPNLFRDFLGEGAANAAFVPVFSEYLERRDRQEFWELANTVLNLLLVMLMGITLLGIIFSPFIVRLIAPGFAADPSKFAATVNLNRIIFPYLLLVGLFAYATAILNSLRHFALPAFAPCLLNISIIVFAILFGEGIKGLACGVLVGGLLQLTVQIPLLYKKGMRLKLFRRFRHPGAKAIAVLMLPRLFSSCIYQLNNFVDSIFGSLAVVVGEGGVAVLYFAYRLIHFPLGVFSNALSQAILPTFSSQVLEERKERLKESLSFGLRGVFFVILPASAIFISSSRLLVDSLFGGGRFDDYSIEKTSAALFFYSIGLFAYAAAKMMQSCFFALKDTLTPAKVSALALGLNILFNILLMFPLGIGGIALATSISGIITALILFSLLKRRLAPFPLAPIAGSFLRILLASIFMGVVCCFVSRRGLFFSGHTLWRLCALSLHLALGAVTYIIFSLVFRVREMQELWRWAVKRKTPTRRL